MGKLQLLYAAQIWYNVYAKSNIGCRRAYCAARGEVEMRTIRLRTLKKHVAKMIFAIAAAFAVQGCSKKDYCDPEDFLAKYLDEILGEKYSSRRWLDAMELKGLEVKNVRLEPYYGLTAVCADLQFVRKSDKTVYMYSPSSFYQAGKILTGDEVTDVLSAEAKIRRFQLDNGVFVPESKSFSGNIQGYGLLSSLRVADLDQIRANAAMTIRKVGAGIEACKDAEALESAFTQLIKLAVLRHLDYVDNKEVLQQYFDILDKCLIAAETMKTRYKPRLVIAKEDMAVFNEMCIKKGMQTPREQLMAALRTADFDAASPAARLVLANNRDDPSAHFALGTWHYKNQHWADAEWHFLRCKELRPKDVAVWNNLAMTYLQMGRLDVARSHAGHALTLIPDSSSSDSASLNDRISMLKSVRDTLSQIDAAEPNRRDRKTR